MSPQEGGATSPQVQLLSPHIRALSQGSRKQRGERATWKKLTPSFVEQTLLGINDWDLHPPRHESAGHSEGPTPASWLCQGSSSENLNTLRAGSLGERTLKLGPE